MVTTFLRTIILYVIVIIAVRIMGKRQIGELQPSELVVTILISDLAAVPMQGVEIPLINGIIPIFTLVAFEIILSIITLKSVRARKYLCGSANIIINKGQVDQKLMKRLRITVDDLLEDLRLGGYISIKDIEYAIMETNGKLSIFPKQANDSTPPAQNGIPKVVVCDGKTIDANIAESGVTFSEINDYLKTVQVEHLKEVLLLTVDDSKKYFLVKNEKRY